jgi:hypothetical protein
VRRRTAVPIPRRGEESKVSELIVGLVVLQLLQFLMLGAIWFALRSQSEFIACMMRDGEEEVNIDDDEVRLSGAELWSG